MSMNNITLLGRLAADPELRKTNSDVSYTRFTIAVDRPYKNGGDHVTDWIDCEAWRTTADYITKYFHKGQLIGLIGSLQINTWQDNDGNTRRRSVVYVEKASSAGGQGTGGGESKPASGGQNIGQPGFIDLPNEDNLPF